MKFKLKKWKRSLVGIVALVSAMIVHFHVTQLLLKQVRSQQTKKMWKVKIHKQGFLIVLLAAMIAMNNNNERSRMTTV